MQTAGDGKRPGSRRAQRLLLSGLFGLVGALHFLKPEVFEQIVPAAVPARPAVLWSGAAELLGALGLLFPATRRFAGWGLFALLLAVWPANFEMARRAEDYPQVPGWLLQVRVVLQLPLLWWVWRVVLRKPNERSV